MNNDNFLNKTGLTYFWNRIKTIFAKQTDLDTLEDKVDEIIAEGGEPNVIETVKVNGTALVPVNKAVDVDVPTEQEIKDLADGRITNSISSATDNSIASKKYVSDNGGKIDTIKVNGTTQTITNKAVDLTVPTKVSDLTNDSNFQTGSEVDTKIENALTSAMVYKGSVATKANLPTTGNKVGDFYNVLDEETNYAWDGTKWDPAGSTIDTSTLWAKSELTAITTAEIDQIIV